MHPPKCVGDSMPLIVGEPLQQTNENDGAASAALCIKFKISQREKKVI
jgi:hypothetical protein